MALDRFRGEQLFTSALLNVTQTKPVKAYFLQGHGEHSLNEEDQGYGRFVKMLRNNNIQAGALNPLMAANDIPPDCGLLIIGGPSRQLDRDELIKIDRYLARGGRMFAMLNILQARQVPVGLEQLLLNWNIQAGLDWVQDPAQAEAGDPYIFLASNYGTHPIVRSMLRTSVKMYGPRSVSRRAGQQPMADAPKVTEILFTSSAGRLITPAENPGEAIVAKQGSLPLAVAAERGKIQGVSAEDGSTRIVVVGESMFVSNLLIGHMANSDFANQIVNWLVNRDSLLNEIGPSPLSEYQILLTEAQMRQVRWLFLGAIPGAAVVLGFFVWMRRRV